jgi:hypothetical protein
MLAAHAANVFPAVTIWILSAEATHNQKAAALVREWHCCIAAAADVARCC